MPYAHLLKIPPKTLLCCVQGSQMYLRGPTCSKTRGDSFRSPFAADGTYLLCFSQGAQCHSCTQRSCKDVLLLYPHASLPLISWHLSCFSLELKNMFFCFVYSSTHFSKAFPSWFQSLKQDALKFWIKSPFTTGNISVPP